eukprot:CAMPEP_0197532156 /NCGR_PEP_ID=MMETSP1318-20131121/38695_1 /TAXON_ID=552666 /ORGANISM="Partenskyella glossopodia, Strain RCC365" /LENGTH=385 /DNA_ID=CAMNT_0043088629 /DNA_START=159 /DNA_END=1316 /DNA_ORIENTATION=+
MSKMGSLSTKDIVSFACQGFLLEKAKTTRMGYKRWKKRYFVLNPNKRTLEIYGSESRSNPQGIIPLVGIMGIEEVSDDKKHSETRFDLRLKGEWLISLRASTLGERKRWCLNIEGSLSCVGYISNVIESYKNQQFWSMDIARNLLVLLEKELRESKVFNKNVVESMKIKEAEEANRRISLVNNIDERIQEEVELEKAKRINHRKKLKFTEKKVTVRTVSSSHPTSSRQQKAEGELEKIEEHQQSSSNLVDSPNYKSKAATVATDKDWFNSTSSEKQSGVNLATPSEDNLEVTFGRLMQSGNNNHKFSCRASGIGKNLVVMDSEAQKKLAALVECSNESFDYTASRDSVLLGEASNRPSMSSINPSRMKPRKSTRINGIDNILADL